MDDFSELTAQIEPPPHLQYLVQTQPSDEEFFLDTLFLGLERNISLFASREGRDLSGLGNG